jgi:hypothetical protein
MNRRWAFLQNEALGDAEERAISVKKGQHWLKEKVLNGKT